MAQRKKEQSYRDLRMKQAGLTQKDQESKRFDYGKGPYGGAVKSKGEIVHRFIQGTFDAKYNVIPGDDLIIRYLGLDREDFTYYPENSKRSKPFFRVRWQFPEFHPGKDGKPTKYGSPKGSGVFPYFPEPMIKAYESRLQMETLFIWEGEIKADVAAKHGMLGVGIGGINMLASNKRLPKEFELIIKNCGVRRVVFFMDSDLFDLSGRLSEGGVAANKRPYSFFSATRNFKDYFQKFSNHGIHLELYLGWTKKNEAEDKGIDDLINGSLKKQKKIISEEIHSYFNDKHFAGTHVQLRKITTDSDSALRRLWGLSNVDEFANQYKLQLSPLGKFLYWNTWWMIDDEGKVKLAQPLAEDQKYWQTKITYSQRGDEKKTTVFNYSGLRNYLYSKEYGKFEQPNNNFCFIHILNNVVHRVAPHQIKDHVIKFTEEINKKEVLELILKGGDRYLGPASLSNLRYISPNFLQPAPDHQYLFFHNKFWKVDATGVKEKSTLEMPGQVWESQIHPFDPSLQANSVIRVEKVGKKYFLEQNITAYNCDFLTFLKRASNFHWKSSLNKEFLEPALEYEWHLHLLNKMTAFGYLLHSFRNPSFSKAVVAMDGRMSEVGESNGRSGKSLFGLALEQMISTIRIDGKDRKLTEDRFIYEEVSEETKMVFVDDVRKNIDFEAFFPAITGYLPVNKKNIGKVTLKEDKVPKFLFTTNHAINGEGGSYRDRIAFIAFSDYYNDDHKPIDDFGVMFFKQWEYDQWNYFYNFCANCLVLYFQELVRTNYKSGIIQAPMERVERRVLRQKIGEDLIEWADAYFTDTTILNKRVEKKILYNDYLIHNPKAKVYTNARRFKKCLRLYAEFRGLKLNPQIQKSESNPNCDDKSAGKEYITIADKDFNPDSMDRISPPSKAPF